MITHATVQQKLHAIVDQLLDVSEDMQSLTILPPVAEEMIKIAEAIDYVAEAIDTEGIHP